MATIITLLNSDFNNPKLPSRTYPMNQLQALYLMDNDPSGGVVLDSSGNGNNGVNFGATQSAEGYDFDSAYLDTPVKLKEEHTIFIVFKLDSITDGSFQFLTDNQPESSRFYTRSQDVFVANLDIGTATLLRGNVERSRINGNWVFAALSVKAGSQELFIPQAGFLFSGATPSDGGVIGSPTINMKIGWDTNETASYLKYVGGMATVGVYDRYMSQQELADLYASAKSQLLPRGIDLALPL